MFNGQLLQKKVNKSYGSCVLHFYKVWWKVFNISVKFDENISHGFQVTKRTWVYDQNHYKYCSESHIYKSW